MPEVTQQVSGRVGPAWATMAWTRLWCHRACGPHGMRGMAKRQAVPVSSGRKGAECPDIPIWSRVQIPPYNFWCLGSSFRYRKRCPSSGRPQPVWPGEWAQADSQPHSDPGAKGLGLHRRAILTPAASFFKSSHLVFNTHKLMIKENYTLP